MVSILDLYEEPDYYSNDLALGEFASNPVNLIGASDELPQLPWQQQSTASPQVQTGNLMQRIQEALGAKEPDQGGTVADILSSRFGGNSGTSYGDYAQGVVQSAMGKPTLGTDVGQSRINGYLKQMESIANLEKISAQADLYRAGGSGNATIKAAQTIMAENPGMTFSEAFSFAKSGLGQGITYKPGVGVTTMPGAPEAAGSMEFGKKAGGARGDLTVKKEENLPAATAGLQSTLQSSDIVSDSISKALTQSGDFTTGFMGAVTKNIPGTPAYNLARTVDTIKANIGFDKLAQMRATSKTGGALGQVSDFENRMLQSVIANLEQSQSKEQFEANLLAVNEQYKKSLANIKQAYINDYGNTDGFDQMFGQLPVGNQQPAISNPQTGATNWIIQNGKLVKQ